MKLYKSITKENSPLIIVADSKRKANKAFRKTYPEFTGKVKFKRLKESKDYALKNRGIIDLDIYRMIGGALPFTLKGHWENWEVDEAESHGS